MQTACRGCHQPERANHNSSMKISSANGSGNMHFTMHHQHVALSVMLVSLVCCQSLQVAIKQLERAHLVLRYVESELINHSQLRHPHVRGRQ